MNAEPPTEELTWFSWIDLDLPVDGPVTAGLRGLRIAIRDHERTARRSDVAMRPSDHALYRRLTEIEAADG